MDKDFDKLDDIFNVSGEIIHKSSEEESSIIPKVIEGNSDQRNIDLKNDYEYTRGTIYSLVEKGQELINGILEVAQETESARAYEVAGQLIKSVSDATDKLINLHKNLKDIEEVKQAGPTNVTNALFVGSTAELSKLLKSQRKESSEDK
jgi:predicted house-cleaning noncanonical NTP pyrophosphatase (MazG superfamily)